MIKTETKPTFRDFLSIVFSQKAVIVSVFIGVTLLAFIFTFITPPVYESNTKILAKERKVEDPLQPRYYSDFRTERNAFLQAQIEIILSDEISRRVMKKTNGRGEPTQKDLKVFQQRIKVASPKGYDITSSDVLLINVAGSNPVKVAEAANLITDEYINYSYELKGKAAKQTVQFLEKQTQVQIEKLKAAENEIKNYEGKSGTELAFLISTVKTRGANPELITMNSNYLSAKASLKETETFLNELRVMVRKGGLPHKILRENPVLASIKDNIARLQTQLASLRSQYTDIYPRNAMLIKEIERNKELLKQEVHADLDSRGIDMVALEARVKSLKDTVDQYTTLAQKQLEYSRLYRNYELLEEGYQNLLRDVEKARVSEAMDTFKLASVEIIDRAKVPRTPVSPDIIVNISIGAVIGILLGFGLAFLGDYYDHTLKSLEDVERYLSIPVLGALPRY